MTQILIPSTDILASHAARVAADDLLAALDAATAIPTEGGDILTIAGQRGAQYGALILIDAERRMDDPTGPTWARRWRTHVAPEDATSVVLRMVEEGRTIYGITAVRGALGGTATR